MNKVLTGPVDENLTKWVKGSKNFALIGILVATASDTHTVGAYYHLVCYTRLREAALTANRQESKKHSPPFSAVRRYGPLAPPLFFFLMGIIGKGKMCRN